MRQTIEAWLAMRALPHCLFSGRSGTGKTSLVLLLLDLLEIPSEDLLRINASRVRKVDELQDKIANFIDAWAFNPTGMKYIFLDESDRLSQHAQGMLRGDMENFPTCRFLMTCNEPRRIIPALHSRVQEIKFTSLDQGDFAMRVASVLDAEQIQFEPERLMTYLDRLYPDLRKCIGEVQKHCRDHTLLPLDESIEGTMDYLPEVIALFKTGRYHEARRRLIERADPEDYIAIFREFYQHLDWFAEAANKQDRALIVIRDAMLNHAVAADQEINMAALLAELSLIAE